MKFDNLDVMLVEVPRRRPFAMSDHYPVIAGRLPDGRLSYIFDWVGKERVVYEGSGPSPEESRCLKQNSDREFILAMPSPSDALYVRVLRYDPDAYMKCESYASKMRPEKARLDPSGPLFWKFRRYLPADERTRNKNEAVGSDEGIDDNDYHSCAAYDEGQSTRDCENESECSEDVVLESEEGDWRTAGGEFTV